ncbi:MAG: hypothetical protein HWE11_16055 [Gammaproteobacteria bacterium]|nr:hypothetical protein [Gammaproteobacteria bacterium]
MVFLIISIAVLAIAPLLAKLFSRSPRFENVLSGFLLVVLGGIILVELMPLSVHNGGWIAVPIALLGLTGPTLIERAFHRAADSTHQLTLLVGFSGLLLHTMADGASLADFSTIDSASRWLPLAIVLHRIPVALSVLWIIRPVFGFKGVWLALTSLALFTLFGYVLGVQLESAMNSTSFAWLQAFVSGTLLHVLLHRPHRHDHGVHQHSEPHESIQSFEHTNHDPLLVQQPEDGHAHQEHTHAVDAHSDHSHTHAHTHTHEHSLLEPLRSWDRYKLLGTVIGALTLALLSELH